MEEGFGLRFVVVVVVVVFDVDIFCDIGAACYSDSPFYQRKAKTAEERAPRKGNVSKH